MPNVKVKRLHPNAIIPQRQTAGAACFDIHALHGSEVLAGGATGFLTGLAFEIPDGWVLKIYSRSGHGFKNLVCLVNGTGVIDADYRGEVHVKLINHGDKLFVVNAGDRIAQAMLERVEPVEFVVVDDLSETERGDGGFGSTGVSHAN